MQTQNIYQAKFGENEKYDQFWESVLHGCNEVSGFRNAKRRVITISNVQKSWNLT